MDLHEVSWAIGLFEGEGCIFVGTHYGYDYARVSIGMTDRDIIERFACIVPGGGSINLKRGGSSKPLYHYEINRREVVEEFLRTIRPFLSKKKTTECDLALSTIDKAKSRSPKEPSYKRPPKSITSDEIAMMRKARSQGTLVRELAEQYRISITHASRLTKDVAVPEHIAARNRNRSGLSRKNSKMQRYTS